MDRQATKKSPSSDTQSSGSDEEDKDDDLKIKLKLSRSEEGGPSSSPTPMVRVCEHCGKEFSNGKALGGHIRIHTRGQKNQEIPKRIESSPRIQDSIDQENLDREAIEKRICPICDRVFRSVKSLFGHMRFHPESRYRGLQPPEDEETSSLSSSSDDDEEDEKTNSKSSSSDLTIDLMKDLPNWSRTDKRGRGSTCEAALNLIKLASAVSLGRAFETLDESTEKRKHDREDNGVYPRDDKKRENPVLSTPKERVDGPIKGRIRFACNTCGRVFPTFQALGGHRSSHSRDKTASPHPYRDNLSRQNHRSQSVSASTEALEKKTAVGGPYKCEICRKNFLSGQALGGHKRCHWATESGSGAKNDDSDDQASQVGPDPGSGLGSREPMDIDLNKLPSMEVDEDGSVRNWQ